MRHLAALPALAALAVLAVACGSGAAPPPASTPPPRACTEIGCVDGLHVELTPGSRWPAGRYRIDVEADGAAQSCEAVLPLKACDAGPSAQCSGAALATIGESGCALPPADHGLSDINFSGAPKRVHVRITRDGAAIADKDISPTYKRLQPNGPGCEPVCSSASEGIALSL
jgi:hypothetical protein